MDLSILDEGYLQQFEDYKKHFPIGIYGPFSNPHLQMLKSLKTALVDEKYNARISLDIGESDPQREEENRDDYNGRMSDRLVNESMIHILLLFVEGEGEHSVNESALFELSALFERKRNDSILILGEKTVEMNAFLQRRGIFWSRRRMFNYSQLTNFESVEDVVEVSASFCYVSILRYYKTLGYNE
ncbi:MAG: hypothetical protein ABFC38_10540 [Methanospirillum sp.]